MAYQNLTFPNPKLVHGLRKEVIKPTTIISNGTTEYRISKSATLRSRWTWQGRLIREADRLTIHNFINSMDMSLDSFNFVCPFDGLTYKVRLDQMAYGFTGEAFDTEGNLTVVNMGDITLIQVIE